VFRFVSLHGAPRYLRSDNGREFVSRAILRWITTAGIDTAFIDPGKPWPIIGGLKKARRSMAGRFDQRLDHIGEGTSIVARRFVIQRPDHEGSNEP
jgi:hypothetical protein